MNQRLIKLAGQSSLGQGMCSVVLLTVCVGRGSSREMGADVSVSSAVQQMDTLIMRLSDQQQ